MKTRSIVVVTVLMAAVGAAGFGLYRLGMNQGMRMASPMSPAGAGTNVARQGDEKTGTEDRKVLYWHDPMVPGQKFDKPGKSPFMDMQLVPVYAGVAGDEGKTIVSSRMQQNLGIRTAEVVKGNVTSTVTAVGSVAYNERDVALVQTRSNGFVERLHVRAPLDAVRKGQPLVELYVPDWVAAQEEFFSVRRMQGRGIDGLIDGARQRMRLAGMSDDQIRAVEAGGKVQPRFTITSPIDGVVAELMVREGMTVMAGASLFRINGLGTIWVNAEVPENLSGQVRPGIEAEATTPSVPGRTFKGKVSRILPEVNAITRTIKARVELANPSGQLVPGMFATVSFKSSVNSNVLLVPSEAVIRTGTRNVVIVTQADGRFAQTDVEIGADANGQTEIRKGLEAGQKIVVSGQFLIDSEASLKASTTRMSDAPAAESATSGEQVHRAQGKVESVSKDEITVAHGPVPSLQWGPMTMGFKLPPKKLPANVKAGDSVTFEFKPATEGTYEITSIAGSNSASAAASEATGRGLPKTGAMSEPMTMPPRQSGGAK